MQKILLAGWDSRLLATRAAVLKGTGADVICCNPGDAIRFLDSEDPDLVVVCYSLGEDEADVIVDHVREHRPQTKIIMLVASAGQEGVDHKAGFDATIVSEPEKLVAFATAFLRSAPSHDRAGRQPFLKTALMEEHDYQRYVATAPALRVVVKTRV